ncbi:hypothetical protein [Mesomycoplasma conjunctivae]|uniref:hypothetical protein n=1 Tax=Mesomycoplasma conjunctivae TaxID=45361 RepID=UPI003DA22446
MKRKLKLISAILGGTIALGLGLFFGIQKSNIVARKLVEYKSTSQIQATNFQEVEQEGTNQESKDPQVDQPTKPQVESTNQQESKNKQEKQTEDAKSVDSKEAPKAKVETANERLDRELRERLFTNTLSFYGFKSQDELYPIFFDKESLPVGYLGEKTLEWSYTPSEGSKNKQDTQTDTTQTLRKSPRIAKKQKQQQEANKEEEKKKQKKKKAKGTTKKSKTKKDNQNETKSKERKNSGRKVAWESTIDIEDLKTSVKQWVTEVGGKTTKKKLAKQISDKYKVSEKDGERNLELLRRKGEHQIIKWNDKKRIWEILTQ